MQLTVEERLSHAERPFFSWSKKFHKNSPKSLEDTKQKLEAAMSNSKSNEALIHELNLRLLHLYKSRRRILKTTQQTIIVSPWGLQHWIFHTVAKGRSAKNRLSVIAYKNDVPVYEEEETSRAISWLLRALWIGWCWWTTKNRESSPTMHFRCTKWKTHSDATCKWDKGSCLCDQCR